MDEKTVTCPICGRQFHPIRSTAVTCSQPCRQKLYRLRNGGSVAGLKMTKTPKGKEKIRRPALTVTELRAVTSRARAGAKQASAAARKLAEANPDGLRRHDPAAIGNLESTLRLIRETERLIEALGITLPDDQK